MPQEQHEKRVKEFHRYLDVVAWVAGIAAAIVAGAIMFTPVQVEAHDGHTVTNAQYMGQVEQFQRQAEGRREISKYNASNLYGVNRNRPEHGIVNCCVEKDWQGKQGDCREIEPPTATPTGWLMPDGDVVPYGVTNVSPDDKFYGCKYEGQKTHCLFAPPQGF